MRTSSDLIKEDVDDFFVKLAAQASLILVILTMICFFIVKSVIFAVAYDEECTTYVVKEI